MGLRAYLVGGALAIALAWGAGTLWLWNARASLLEQRAGLQRELAISAEVLARMQAAQVVADSTADAEATRARAAEKQIRLILNQCSQALPLVEGEANELPCEGDCPSSAVDRALEWLRSQ